MASGSEDEGGGTGGGANGRDAAAPHKSKSTSALPAGGAQQAQQRTGGLAAAAKAALRGVEPELFNPEDLLAATGGLGPGVCAGCVRFDSLWVPDAVARSRVQWPCCKLACMCRHMGLFQLPSISTIRCVQMATVRAARQQRTLCRRGPAWPASPTMPHRRAPGSATGEGHQYVRVEG